MPALVNSSGSSSHWRCLTLVQGTTPHHGPRGDPGCPSEPPRLPPAPHHRPLRPPSSTLWGRSRRPSRRGFGPHPRPPTCALRTTTSALLLSTHSSPSLELHSGAEGKALAALPTSSLELAALTSRMRALTNKGRLGARVTSTSSQSSIVEFSHQNSGFVHNFSLGKLKSQTHIRELDDWQKVGQREGGGGNREGAGLAKTDNQREATQTSLSANNLNSHLPALTPHNINST